MRPKRSLILKVLGAAALAVALSGCVVYPAYRPYYHPYGYWR
jgi:hypothetical protein